MAYLEIEKISYAADSSHVTIDSAGYYLAWVYRTVDSHKDYYLLPEGANKGYSNFIKDAESRAARKIFLEDSRLLFGKYNQGVTEMRRMPARFERTIVEAGP